MPLDKPKASRDTWTLIYTNMDAALLQAELQRRPDQGFSAMIKIVRQSIGQVKAATGQPFLDEEEEITFFRDIWPKFYAKLFYYQLVNNFESDREGKSRKTQTRLTREAKLVIADYFEENKEFWSYYRDNSEVINPQFTRKYSESCHLDPLSELLDKEWATIAGNRAAWALAYGEFGDYLNSINASSPEGWEDWEWKENLTDAAVLIKALARKKSIYINGKPATITRLKAAAEKHFRIDLTNFHKLIYATDIRKEDQAEFLTNLRDIFIDSRD